MGVAKRARDAGHRGELPTAGWKSRREWEARRAEVETRQLSAGRARSVREGLAVGARQLDLFGDES